MRNIKKIFFRDVAALFKNPFALIIAGGLCILPALYAWFNIYSNWDPYGNTGNIKIAVASEDKGYTDSGGSYANVAETVIETLKENESIDWVVVPESDTAVEGVYDGSYYAAVVFAPDFTECMYQGFLDGLKRPTAVYYENEKKNAVATKITDTAVSTLENNINEQYISLVVSTFFDKQRQTAGKMEDAKLAETITAKIGRAKNTVENFSAAVRSLVQANQKLTASLDGADSDLNTINGNLEAAKEKLADTPDAQALTDKMYAVHAQAMRSVSDALSQLNQFRQAKKENVRNQADDIKENLAAKKKAVYGQMGVSLANAKASLDDLINSIQSVNAATVNVSHGIVLSQLENQSQALEAAIARLNSSSVPAETDVTDTAEDRQLELQIGAIQQAMQTTVSQSLAALGNELQRASAEMVQVTGNVSEDLELLSMILNNSTDAVELTNEAFSGMAKDMDVMCAKLDQVMDVINGMSQAQLAQNVLNFMQGNSKEYGAFFAQPVTIETQAVYPVENYGSGVAPFYTTLALWVGGVVLVSLIKVKAYKDGLDQPKAHELFLGRYLLFFVLALIQAAVTVWGNFYLLHIQCLYPRRFLLAAFMTSITFSLLIYALTISFGDVGKAVIVVIMVIQIAGSSGTYPIEILPQFYQKLYIFFPFPYAINAMREAVAGMYEHDFTLNLLRLSIFAAAALALGLVIRLPFRRFYHFVEKRMEDTRMM